MEIALLYKVWGPVNRPKGMFIMRCESTDGFKTRADRLIGDGLNCRWSRQAGGYVVSPSKLKKFEKLFSEGWDASAFTGELYPPSKDEEVQ